jgi:hypothetical protein
MKTMIKILVLLAAALQTNTFFGCGRAGRCIALLNYITEAFTTACTTVVFCCQPNLTFRNTYFPPTCIKIVLSDVLT